MKNKIFFFVILLSSFSFSQVQFSKGVELGVNRCGKIYEYESYLTHGKKTVRNVPITSPIFGVWTKFNFDKHAYAHIGLQYLTIGNKYHFYYAGVDPNGIAFVSEKWENQIFQKISLPLSFGFDFKIRKLKASFFLGYKFNYFTHGSRFSKQTSYKVDNSNYYNYESTINPFDECLPFYASRISITRFIGFGLSITEKLSFETSFTSLTNLQYSNTLFCFMDSYFRNDIALSLKYVLE